jgi:uncharacterized membrane protein
MKIIFSLYIGFSMAYDYTGTLRIFVEDGALIASVEFQVSEI